MMAQRYSGYQIQINGKTVQEVLEEALSKMHKGMEVKVTSSAGQTRVYMREDKCFILTHGSILAV